MTSLQASVLGERVLLKEIRCKELVFFLTYHNPNEVALLIISFSSLVQWLENTLASDWSWAQTVVPSLSWASGKQELDHVIKILVNWILGMPSLRSSRRPSWTLPLVFCSDHDLRCCAIFSPLEICWMRKIAHSHLQSLLHCTRTASVPS